MSTVNMVKQLPVQMGSNKMSIEVSVNDTTLTCKQFLRVVLERCHIDAQLSRTYALFVACNGIETPLHSTQQILSIYVNSGDCCSFIVRKYLSAEKQAIQRINSQKHQEMVKKCFKKMNSQTGKVEQPMERKQHRQQPHLSNIEQEYLLNQIVQRRQKKSVQTLVVSQGTVPQKTLVSKESEEVFRQEANLASNITILQFLYGKLKKRNNNASNNNNNFNSSYEKLIDNDSCGDNSSDEEVSSNGSRRSASSLHVQFESLV